MRATFLCSATTSATPLHTAAAENNATQITRSSPTALRSTPSTTASCALHVAATWHDEAAAALLAAGADASLVQSRPHAAGTGRPVTATPTSKAVGAGAQLEATEEGARTALHYAAQRGHAPVVADACARRESRGAQRAPGDGTADGGVRRTHEAVARLAASGADLEASHDEPKLTALAAARAPPPEAALSC